VGGDVVELVVPVAVSRAVAPARLTSLEVRLRLFVLVTRFTLLDEKHTLWKRTCWEHMWELTLWVKCRARALTAGTRDLLFEAMLRSLRWGRGRRIRRQLCRALRDSFESEARAACVHLLDG
jgi:hypothetical protein